MVGEDLGHGRHIRRPRVREVRDDRGTATMTPTSVQPRALQCAAPSRRGRRPIGARIKAPHANSHVTRVSAPTRSMTRFESTMYSEYDRQLSAMTWAPTSELPIAVRQRTPVNESARPTAVRALGRSMRSAIASAAVNTGHRGAEQRRRVRGGDVQAQQIERLVEHDADDREPWDAQVLAQGQPAQQACAAPERHEGDRRAGHRERERIDPPSPVGRGHHRALALDGTDRERGLDGPQGRVSGENRGARRSPCIVRSFGQGHAR